MEWSEVSDNNSSGPRGQLQTSQTGWVISGSTAVALAGDLLVDFAGDLAAVETGSVVVSSFFTGVSAFLSGDFLIGVFVCLFLYLVGVCDPLLSFLGVCDRLLMARVAFRFSSSSRRCSFFSRSFL